MTPAAAWAVGHPNDLSSRAGGRVYRQRLPWPWPRQRMGLSARAQAGAAGRAGPVHAGPDERYRSSSWLDRFLDDLTASVENRTQAALYLMAHKPWDLFTVVYWDTDMVQHETWRLLDPTHPRHDSAEAQAQREQILAFHRKIDSDVGRLLASDSVDPAETLVVVMSDHGFGPVHSFFLTNKLAGQSGIVGFQAQSMDRFQAASVPPGLYPA